MSDIKQQQQAFSIREQACVKVVVFTDRAEVQRSLKTKLKKGENELIINSISSSIDRDSIRVDGRGGNATVLDVICQNKRVHSEKLDNISDKEKELKNEIVELETKRDSTNNRLERLNKQISVLNEFANSLSKVSLNGENNSGSSMSTFVQKESVDNFLNFLDTYSTKLETLDELKYKLTKELNKINEKINIANENLSKQRSGNYKENIELTILVEANAEDTEIELLISYVVYDASWVPKYDIRVFSNDKEKSMTINYFGVITQSTGEDWNDTKLSLSTAVPSVGGNVPELTTQNVSVRRAVYGGLSRNSTLRKTKKRIKRSISCLSLQKECEEIQYLTAEVQKSNAIGSTATFEIPRVATIQSDNSPHKVTIGLINLKPDFEYESVPKKTPYAYIKAKVINASEYSLLGGPANVFLDNNFVAKTELKSYSPQEELIVSLGVDPAIKIDYKPLRKFKGQNGLLAKTTVTTYSQVIEIKNTTAVNAKILLSDNIPLSNDDKIHVKLLEPSLKNNPIVKLNKANNIEFDLSLTPNKSQEITIKYSIEHPSDKEIDFS